ncbi:hypothetical protein Q3G72_031916 [Acer saccharum]|nr:hypothetical protein Q3G72_031916 [Acer saccharum]
MDHNGDYFSNLINSQYSIIDQHDEYSLQSTIPGEDNPIQNIPTKKRVKRQGKYRIEEDLLLVSAWLNTSMDPVQGTLQKNTSFWSRINAYYHENKGMIISDRDQNGLEHRWSAIQIAVNKFCGFYKQIEGRHQSGLTQNDKTLQAMKMFHEIQGTTFQFLHCWNELRHAPKWITESSMKKSKNSKIASLATSSPAIPDTKILGEAEVDNVEVMARPIGRKAAKERLKKDKDKQVVSNITPVTLFIEEMKEERKEKAKNRAEFYSQIYIQEQERIKIEQERLHVDQENQNLKKEKMRLKIIKNDERIMAIDRIWWW